MITLKESIGLIGPYVKQRIIDQIKAVAVIIVYLIAFQTIVLGIPIAGATGIALGLSLVVVGLTFFMEGLVLGLMPLGEIIGLKLPQKSKLPVILTFAFILGMGATFAEPAISVLKSAGASVKAWKAPLLFLLLNKHSDILVYSVGIGVGTAVVFGMLRFIYNWSLKPFIYVLVGGVCAMSAYGYFDPNLLQLTGLAWDCGAVTTGPVTVPLVLALGIGISRVVGSGDSASGGFGVVTLASLFPILTVLLLGFFFNSSVPQPTEEANFFSQKTREKTINLFNNEKELLKYAASSASLAGKISAFGSEEKLTQFENQEKTKTDLTNKNAKEGSGFTKLLSTHTIAALQAIIPLSLFLVLTLWFVLRDKLPVKDEVFFGIFLATLGMAIFSIGIELGLSKMGGQVGSVLPSAYKKVELTQSEKTIKNFDETKVQTAFLPTGKTESFFYTYDHKEFETVPFKNKNLNRENSTYTYSPTKGPLFGVEGGLTGILVVLLFAFFMGYGATLAEPALNALGATVETITVGNFKKSLLMQCVALGVGVGILLGVAKIIWDIPLAIMLVPPYMLLLIITALSTEEFVNIGWDSAGVTTGPITVPLVLAMGLGIGAQAGVVEGFGILAMASVCPILSVLSVGLYVSKKRKENSQEASTKNIDSNHDNFQKPVKKSA